MANLSTNNEMPIDHTALWLVLNYIFFSFINMRTIRSSFSQSSTGASGTNYTQTASTN